MFATLCHNPDAGVGDHSQTHILAALKQTGIEARYCNMDSDDFPKMLCETADLIIAAGGDGTVAKVAKNMPDRSIPLAILPLGSANDIARSFGIVGSPRELAKDWDLDRWAPFDIGFVAGPWGEGRFVEAVGLGPIPEMIERKSKEEQTDKVSAGRDAVREEIAEAPALDVELFVDGDRIAGDDILAIEILNVPYTGPRLPLLEPGTKPSGMLGIVVIRQAERDATLSWLKMPSGRAPFSRFSGRKIELQWSGALLRVDDEVVDLPPGEQHVTTAIDGMPVKVLIPKSV
jgi:diacylglycerol kinase family enzyme